MSSNQTLQLNDEDTHDLCLNVIALIIVGKNSKCEKLELKNTIETLITTFCVPCGAVLGFPNPVGLQKPKVFVRDLKMGSHEQILTKNAQNRRKIDFFENRPGTAKVTYGVEI